MTLPLPLDNLLRDELKPGERLLWCGQPNPWRMAFKLIIPFIVGLAFFSVATFMIVNAILKNEVNEFSWGSLGAVLFFCVFAVVGFSTAFSPVWAWYAARKTIYAITSKRALVIKSARGVSVFNHAPECLGSVSRKQRADGSGDLLLYGYSHDINPYSPDDFFGIPDVREVERILTAMRDENLRASNQGGKT